MDTKALPILLSATECSQAKSAEVPITDKTCYPPFQCHSNISFNACVFLHKGGWVMGIFVGISLLGTGLKTFSGKG